MLHPIPQLKITKQVRIDKNSVNSKNRGQTQLTLKKDRSSASEGLFKVIKMLKTSEVSHEPIS